MLLTVNKVNSCGLFGVVLICACALSCSGTHNAGTNVERMLIAEYAMIMGLRDAKGHYPLNTDSAIRDIVEYDADRFNCSIKYESDGLRFSYIVSPKNAVTPLPGFDSGLPTRVYIIRPDGIYKLDVNDAGRLPVIEDDAGAHRLLSLGSHGKSSPLQPNE